MKTQLTLTHRLSLAVVILLLAVFSALPLIPHRAVPADAPPSRFSARRAMNDLAVIAREPHAAGSEAQSRVRDYILGQVEAIGLSAEIQADGQISNILVRLPGSDPTLMVLVTGHYDSHPPAPGAGDNGISVAAMLEALRVLHASPALRNDVLFLFTDGEELGYKGAFAYIRANPQARDETGVLLVFDARPGNAAMRLSETSSGDAWLIGQAGGLRLPLAAGSWENREERTEQDTDFDTFQPAGFTGMVIENEANGIRYHTSLDTVDAISPGLLQGYGEAILMLTERYASRDLSTRTEGPDAVYFNLPLAGIVAYPSWVMTSLSILGIAVLVGFMVMAWRRSLLSIKCWALSLLGLILGITLITLCAQLLWGLVTKAHTAELASFDAFEGSAAWLGGMMIGAVILMSLLLLLLTRRLGRINLAAAGAALYLILFFAVYLLMDSDNPLTTAYIAWPFLGGVAGIGVLLFTKHLVWKVVLLALSALTGLALMVPFLMLGTYTREDAWIPILAFSVSFCLLAPQVGFIFEQRPPTQEPLTRNP